MAEGTSHVNKLGAYPAVLQRRRPMPVGRFAACHSDFRLKAILYLFRNTIRCLSV